MKIYCLFGKRPDNSIHLIEARDYEYPDSEGFEQLCNDARASGYEEKTFRVIELEVDEHDIERHFDHPTVRCSPRTLMQSTTQSPKRLRPWRHRRNHQHD